MKALRRLRERYPAGEARALYELIMERRFGLSRTDILLGKDTNLSAEDKAELQIIVGRVAKGEPVQYVLGSEMFLGREFLVGPGVLIPRPETEGLVGLVRQRVRPGGTVLDIGTGSGCIAVSLALEGYRVTAIDISGEALAYARRNAARLGVDVRFATCDITAPPHPKTLSDSPLKEERQTSSDFPLGGETPLPIGEGLAEAIVSNPPYVCRREAPTMDDNVLLHEPHLALFVPDDDPLRFSRAIADYGLVHLADNGWLFLEINKAFHGETRELLVHKGYRDVAVYRDRFDNERFVAARKG